ncbi:MAG: hypothetical protein AXW12_16245 [Thalassospira sp. Nap_22]|nr:MAG: hypothetical protein AXW12_16245 [Thalassospira sp. Nap_22]
MHFVLTKCPESGKAQVCRQKFLKYWRDDPPDHADHRKKSLFNNGMQPRSHCCDVIWIAASRYLHGSVA